MLKYKKGDKNMGLFSKKRSGVYVIVCHLDGYRCYVDQINFYDGKVYFT